MTAHITLCPRIGCGWKVCDSGGTDWAVDPLAIRGFGWQGRTQSHVISGILAVDLDSLFHGSCYQSPHPQYTGLRVVGDAHLVSLIAP
jgi:hypothetical protein